MRSLAGVLFLTHLVAACADPGTIIVLDTDEFRLGISPEGRITRMEAIAGPATLIPIGARSPLLAVRQAGVYHDPISAEWEGRDSLLTLTYSTGAVARIRAQAKRTHIRFQVAALDSAQPVELAVWGPYATTLDESIGETVGVAIGQGFALGLQALNPRTLGGYPWNENDAMPQIDIFEGDPTDLSEEGKRHVLYRVEAAKPDTFGSTLQAYVRNRRFDRVVPNWGHPKYTAPAFNDGGIVGSAIALFGVPADRALETIGAIEIAEDLPHPILDGEWTKTAPGASAAYVILPFGEETFDRALEIVERSGLGYLYHPEPFATWGHFPLRPELFPSGVEGLKRLVDRAEARGIHVGLHTLSNFITTTDPYVTPVPDPRLATVGTTRLSSDIGSARTAIVVDAPEVFRDGTNYTLRAARIGDEIVQYRAVSEGEPWTLLDVERGAFGTAPADHAAGEPISLLADHGYRVLLSEADLSIEMGRSLGDLFSQTGLRQISFDGLEGNRSTGMGNYGEILFTKAWFDALSPDVRRHYIADASRTSHYFWHIYSRMNWGEPWYAGFRESQTEYRMKNQAYFRRNFMPGMLGWFSLRQETSREDIEWMLARSAAFDAGYAFYTSFDALDQNGQSDEILGLLGRWERARMAGAFSTEQKLRMEDVAGEFHLEEEAVGSWILVPIGVSRLEHDGRERQPGEPTHTTLEFRNSGEQQPASFILSAVKGAISGVTMLLDNRPTDLGVTLRSGEHLVYREGVEAWIMNETWQPVRSVPMDSVFRAVAPGDHILQFDAKFVGSDEARAKLEVRLRGTPERAVATR